MHLTTSFLQGNVDILSHNESKFLPDWSHSSDKQKYVFENRLYI